MDSLRDEKICRGKKEETKDGVEKHFSEKRTRLVLSGQEKCLSKKKRDSVLVLSVFVSILLRRGFIWGKKGSGKKKGEGKDNRECILERIRANTGGNRALEVLRVLSETVL